MDWSWVTTVAAEGGSALAGAVATDAWQTARTGVSRLFGRAGSGRREQAERWADRTAAEIEQAADEERPATRERLAQTWQQRLADLVEEHPEVVEELQAWAQEVRQRLPVPQQTFIARDSATQYNAPGGSITVNNHP